MKVLYYWLTMGPYHLARMKALQKIPGLELHVWEATGKDDHYWELDYDGLQHHKTLLPGRVLNKKTVRDAAGIFLRELRSRDFDIVVNGAGYFHLAMILPVLRLRLANTKVLLWTESTFRDQQRNAFKERIKKLVLKLYDGVLAAGQRHFDYLVKLGYPGHKIKVVGNVVDNLFYGPQDNGTGAANGILYAGRLLQEKNVGLLLGAYSQYREKMLALDQAPEPLYIVGDGPQRGELERLVGRERIGGVHFTGTLSPGALLGYYHGCSMLVLPSISEPWGLVVNEAMASGLPVIVSENCGCVPELVVDGGNGFVIDPHSEHQLAEKLIELSRNKEKRTKMGQEGISTIKRFTPETYAQNCYAFFKRLLTEA